MDFKELIDAHITHVNEQKDITDKTSEIDVRDNFTKHLLKTLGYNIFGKQEVKNEFSVRTGPNHGKVDLVILKNNQHTIIFECKSLTENLKKEDHYQQLSAYFRSPTIDVRFGVLTNGINYSFYTDLEKSGFLDKEPFFEIDILNLSDDDICMLELFSKSKFDVDVILERARDRRHRLAIENKLRQEIENPSEELICLLAEETIKNKRGNEKKRLISYFSPLVKEAIKKRIEGDIPAKSVSQEDNLSSSDDTIPEKVKEWYFAICGILLGTCKPSNLDLRSMKDGYAIYLRVQTQAVAYLVLKNAKHTSLHLTDVYIKNKKGHSYLGIESLADHKQDIINRVQTFMKNPKNR